MGDECSTQPEPERASAILQTGWTRANKTFDASGRTLTVNGEQVISYIVRYADSQGKSHAADVDVDHNAKVLKLMHTEIIRATKSQIQELVNDPHVQTVEEDTVVYNISLYENLGA